jgi:hypothetical protein
MAISSAATAARVPHTKLLRRCIKPAPYTRLRLYVISLSEMTTRFAACRLNQKLDKGLDLN